MNVLDLFSGIGGFSLGLERAGMRTAAFCEIDPYCRKVLARHWPNVPIHDDIRKLDGTRYAGAVDLVCGGYPCQPFSVAGKQLAEEDPRHLWPEMHRIIREARPRWVVAENVRGHVSLGFDTVAAQLEDDGFTVWPFIVPACAVGAPHRRDRLWIVAYSAGNGRREVGPRESSSPSQNVADTGGGRFSGSRSRQVEQQGRTETECSSEAVADTESDGLGQIIGDGSDAIQHADRKRESEECSREIASMANAMCPRSASGVSAARHWEEGDAGIIDHGCNQFGGRTRSNHWTVEPDVGRVANGVSDRAHRLKSLGNAVVPQIPELIGRTIIAYEQQLGLAA